MKNVIVALVAVVITFTELYAQSVTAQPQKLTLRVTSSTDKPVSFVASVFFKTKTARLDNTIRQTPFEITVESDYINAVFIKTSGDGDLVVYLVKANKVGDQPDLKASSSSAIVVGTRDAEKGNYYQQSF